MPLELNHDQIATKDGDPVLYKSVRLTTIAQTPGNISGCVPQFVWFKTRPQQERGTTHDRRFARSLHWNCGRW